MHRTLSPAKLCFSVKNDEDQVENENGVIFFFMAAGSIRLPLLDDCMSFFSCSKIKKKWSLVYLVGWYME